RKRREEGAGSGDGRNREEGSARARREMERRGRAGRRRERAPLSRLGPDLRRRAGNRRRRASPARFFPARRERRLEQWGCGVELRTPAEARRFLLGVEIPADELTVRLLEAQCGIRRPPHKTAAEALAELDRACPDVVSGFRLGAATAAQFFAECINKAAGI